MSVLREDILRIVAKPKTFVEVEAEIGRHPNYRLGIALAKMAAEGVIHYSTPNSFLSEIPVYSLKKPPKGFKFPKRDRTPDIDDSEKGNKNGIN